MKRLGCVLLLACTPRATTMGSPVDTGAPAPAPDAAQGSIHWIGRFDRQSDASRFSYAGSMVALQFKGESIQADLETNGQDLFTVVVDDGAPKAIHPPAGRSKQMLAQGLSNDTHKLSFAKATESFVGVAKLYGFDAPNGLIVPSAFPFAHRIEIIGDSISCGYGVLGADENCSFTPETESEWHSWGAIAARKLNAAHTTIAYSGKGVVRNSGGETSGTMPSIFERTLADSPDPKWDFNAWSPEVVVINLGTNDFAKGDPGPVFIDGYFGLLTSIRQRYPSAAIVCALGTMMTHVEIGKARAYVGEALKRMNDPRVTYLELGHPAKEDGLGCNRHPSAKTQEKMGLALAAHIKEHMKW